MIQRPTPTKQATVKLTQREAEAVLEACDHFQEASSSLSGSLSVNVARAMRKIAAELGRGRRSEKQNRANLGLVNIIEQLRGEVAARDALLAEALDMLKDMLGIEDEDCQHGWDREPPCPCKWCEDAKPLIRKIEALGPTEPAGDDE